MVRPLFTPATKRSLRTIVNRAVASMGSTVTVRHLTGHDRYGDAYGPPTVYTATVQYRQTVVTNAAGEQVVSTGSIVFPFPAPVIGPEDEIELADGTKPPIKAVTRDGSGDPMIPTTVFI